MTTPYDTEVPQGDMMALDPTEQAMKAAGVNPVEPQYQDYFGFDENSKFMFPDGISFLVLTAMNEGARSKFQKATTSNVRVFKVTGDAGINIDIAKQREELLRASITGWNLHTMQGGTMQPVTFNQSKLNDFISKANPKLIDDVEAAIRKINPWLLDTETVEAIDAEIASLQERRDALVERAATKS